MHQSSQNTGNSCLLSQGSPISVQTFSPGDSLVPCTFCRYVKTTLDPLHRRGIRVLFYSGDLTVMASSRESAALHTAELARKLLMLDFTINWKKSSPLPSQTIIHLGVHMNSLDRTARLISVRLEALNTLLSCISLHRVVSALLV